MFESLTDKFNSVFKSLSGRGRITEANVSDAMRDVRKALLEADTSRKRRAEVIDHVAAGYILQGVLDRAAHLGRG